ncbi:tetratricopeptide repeat protein [Streptomyces tsukubensis]|uniref:tetratricopeptide repeat protein n=1 Tax=Streptomyces tsukubensis TaxID=83656 RepID=UPI00344D7999
MSTGELAGFASVFRQTGWTMRQMAQAVNRVGTERGTPLQYKAPSVHQWCRGALPREDVRPLIVEALSRHLRRPVSPTELGFPAPSDHVSQRPSTVDELLDLGRQDMDPSRRGVIGAGLFSVAMSVPGWQDVVGRMEAVQKGNARRIGAQDVEIVRKMTDRFSELEDDFGGRLARPMAAAFMVNTVVPYLKADASDAIRKEMLSASAFLSYLTGWMAVDEGLHNLAQRYYRTGLEFAGAASDHNTYCHVLRGMSVQAVDLGHGAPAARLAASAAAIAPSTGPRMTAFMEGQQAHALAVAGDKAGALRALHVTERAVSQAESAAGTFGGYSGATLAYHTAQVRYALGDVAGSVASLEDHFRLRDSTDSQVSNLRFSSMLAERRLEMGHLEAACATWGAVLDQHPTMHSDRVDRHVRQITARLKPYRTAPAARDIYARALEAAA